MSDSEKVSRKMGDTIDSLGVELNLYEDDLVTDIVILAKVVDANGNARLSVGWSDGISWIERLGMLTAAGQWDAVPPGGRRD